MRLGFHVWFVGLCLPLLDFAIVRHEARTLGIVSVLGLSLFYVAENNGDMGDE